MKRYLLPGLLMSLAASLFLQAQVPNEGFANAIIAARQANAALMQQYSWNCRTQLSENGAIKDTRIDSVTWGPNGQPQHTTLSDQGNPPPQGFFFRRRIEEAERQQMETYLTSLRTFLHQYTLPSAGQIINLISTSPILPVPGGMLQVSGSSVVVPGDTVSATFSATTRLTQRMTMMTFFQGDEVTVTVTFKSLANGLNYAAYTQVNVPNKNLTLLIQNYDFINQNL